MVGSVESALAPYTHSPRAGVVAVVVVVAATAMQRLVTAGGELGFGEMTVARLGMPAQDSGLTVGQLAAVRTGMAAVALGSLLAALLDRTPHAVNLLFWEESAIVGPVRWEFAGFNRLSTFTVQCWTILTAYLVGAASCSHAVLHDAVDPGWDGAAGALWVLFEMSFALALFVTITVTFVLIPGRLRKGESVELFFTWRGFLFHNANLLFMVIELLLNRAPMRWAHAPFAVLYGVQYGVFSWLWLYVTGVVYYPFADPTLPLRISVPVMLLVIFAMVAFFGIGVTIGENCASLDFTTRAAVVVAASLLPTWTGVFTGVPVPVAQLTND